MRSLRLAFGFLTILPVAPRDPAPMAPARAYFPLVGIALGGILAGGDFLAMHVLPPLASGAILLAIILILTRAIHTEGFIDSCDGLFGGYSPERRLEILRDPHVGAFAVIGGSTLVLAKYALLVGIPDQIRVELLILFPCLSRFGMVLTMEFFPYARNEGLGAAFQISRTKWQVVIASATAVIASGVLLGVGGLVISIAVAGMSLGVGKWFSGLSEGMTGDTYGAVNELAEVSALIMGIAFFHMAPELLGTLFW